MKRLVENTISAAVALLIGFYIGTQWHGKEPANTPEEPLAEPQVAHPVAHVEEPAAPPPASANTSQPSAVQPKPAAQAPPPISPAPELPPQRVAHTETVPGFDSKKLDDVYQQSKSEDAQQRQRALLALAKLGTKEVVSDLISAAADDEESSELRRELIQQIDWSGHTEELGEIISKSRDAEARLAAVNAIAAAENLTDAEFDGLGQTMINNFLIEPEEGIKIATLNCIQARYPDSFQEVLEKYPRVLATPEVQNHLKMIATPPEQMEEASAEKKSEELGE
jgi:hypothetical protein